MYPRNEYRIGGPHDDVARNIRQEQMRDAMPSPEEQERAKEVAEERFIEYKAIERCIDRHDWPFNYDVVMALAEYLEYEQLQRLSRFDWDGMARMPSYPEQHELAAERDGEEDRFVHDRYPAFDERYDVPSDPEDYDIISVDDDTDVRCGEKILNPFGGKKARVVVVECGDDRHIYTNDTFERAMSVESWSDSFDVETISRYQDELGDLYATTVDGVDDDE